MEKYYIWLLMLFGEANPIIHDVLEKYGTAENAYKTINDGDHSLLDKNQAQNLSYVNIAKAEKVIDYCKKFNISLIHLGSKEYPKLLSEIYNPPILLFVRGDITCLDRLSITVVGARNITPYIFKLCSRVCRDLSKKGVTIVSGMAVGVDYTAHSACVSVNNPTVGVLACGMDIDYPHNSKAFREKMILCGGAVITELLPGKGPDRNYFRIRNRILAGLTKGTAVFQASMGSGSLITAAHAVNENRDVFCVPPPDIFDYDYTGVVRFLRDGAIPLFNHDDILQQYDGLYI